MKRIVLSLALLGCSASAFAAPADKADRIGMLKGLIVFEAYSQVCTTPAGELAHAVAQYTLRELETRNPLDAELFKLTVDNFKALIRREPSWCSETAAIYRQQEANIRSQK